MWKGITYLMSETAARMKSRAASSNKSSALRKPHLRPPPLINHRVPLQKSRKLLHRSQFQYPPSFNIKLPLRNLVFAHETEVFISQFLAPISHPTHLSPLAIWSSQAYLYDSQPLISTVPFSEHDPRRMRTGFQEDRTSKIGCGACEGENFLAGCHVVRLNQDSVDWGHWVAFAWGASVLRGERLEFELQALGWHVGFRTWFGRIMNQGSSCQLLYISKVPQFKGYFNR